MKIVLTGFMGTGKSAVGRILARKLGLSFLDTDRIVEERAGRTIREIFRLQGEPFFRSLEKKAIAEAAVKDGVVIATGGGAVLNSENRSILKKDGVVISLLASPAEIRKRTAGDGSRPLLNVFGEPSAKKEKIEELMAARLPFYRKADFCVDTTGKKPGEAAEEIIGLLKLQPKNRGEKR